MIITEKYLFNHFTCLGSRFHHHIILEPFAIIVLREKGRFRGAEAEKHADISLLCYNTSFITA
jgi:hypothetical protein